MYWWDSSGENWRLRRYWNFFYSIRNPVPSIWCTSHCPFICGFCSFDQTEKHSFNVLLFTKFETKQKSVCSINAIQMSLKKLINENSLRMQTNACIQIMRAKYLALSCNVLSLYVTALHCTIHCSALHYSSACHLCWGRSNVTYTGEVNDSFLGSTLQSGKVKSSKVQ